MEEIKNFSLENSVLEWWDVVAQLVFKGNFHGPGCGNKSCVKSLLKLILRHLKLL